MRTAFKYVVFFWAYIAANMFFIWLLFRAIDAFTWKPVMAAIAAGITIGAAWLGFLRERECAMTAPPPSEKEGKGQR